MLGEDEGGGSLEDRRRWQAPPVSQLGSVSRRGRQPPRSDCVGDEAVSLRAKAGLRSDPLQQTLGKRGQKENREGTQGGEEEQGKGAGDRRVERKAEGEELKRENLLKPSIGGVDG